MNILKRENWWIWLLLAFASSGVSTIVLGALLDCFDKDAWYANWKYWLIGFLCFILPGYIMIIVFMIQMLCKVSEKLEVPGKELYLSPYFWIIGFIIPILGWIFIIVVLSYLKIWNLVMLYKGKGEKYI